MYKNNKGFTLVELLAVIVILVIISIIAINRISNVMKKNNENTVIANGSAFLKNVEENAQTSRLTGKFEDGSYTVDELITMGVNMSGTKPKNGTVTITNGKVASACLLYDKYRFISSGTSNTVQKATSCDYGVKKEYIFAQKNEYYTFTAESSGIYRFEAWGAQGGTGPYTTGGKGAYTKGEIELKARDKFYVYVGAQATNATGGYNGGGNGTGNQFLGGGGATDFRLEVNNLNSRIMVAGGGGGSYNYSDSYKSTGGSAGVLVGFSGNATNGPASTGGTQTSAGVGIKGQTACSGSFGIGGNQCGNLGTGGGGGYYGGAGTYNPGGSAESGSGGSSYVSGYKGCIAVSSSSSSSAKCSDSEAIDNEACSHHYSKYIFDNVQIIDGESSMPSHDGKDTITGNTGDGYAKISYLSY